MLRSLLKNKGNKTKSDVDIVAYEKQQNYVVAWNQKSKCNYFNNLNVRRGTKPVGKTCSPYFPNKHYRRDTSIILLKKYEVILNKINIATNFNDYFAETVISLNLFKWTGNVTSLANNFDIIDSIVLNLHCHCSIKAIKNKFRKTTNFLSYRFRY